MGEGDAWFKDIVAQKNWLFLILTLFLFRLGEPFEEETSDGRKCTTTVTMEGNKLITDQKAIKQGEKDVRAVSFLPSELVFFIGLKICIIFLDIIISIYKIQNLQNILIWLSKFSQEVSQPLLLFCFRWESFLMINWSFLWLVTELPPLRSVFFVKRECSLVYLVIFCLKGVFTNLLSYLFV